MKYLGRKKDYDIENIMQENKGRILYHTVSDSNATPVKYAIAKTIIWDSGQECFQIVYSFASDIPVIYVRRYVSNKWMEWKTIS